MKDRMEREAETYWLEMLKDNPNGFTVSDYVNAETIPEAVLFGWQACEKAYAEGAEEFDEEFCLDHLNKYGPTEEICIKCSVDGARWAWSKAMTMVQAQKAKCQELEARLEEYKVIPRYVNKHNPTGHKWLGNHVAHALVESHKELKIGIDQKDAEIARLREIARGAMEINGSYSTDEIAKILISSRQALSNGKEW